MCTCLCNRGHKPRGWRKSVQRATFGHRGKHSGFPFSVATGCAATRKWGCCCATNGCFAQGGRKYGQERTLGRGNRRAAKNNQRRKHGDVTALWDVLTVEACQLEHTNGGDGRVGRNYRDQQGREWKQDKQPRAKFQTLAFTLQGTHMSSRAHALACRTLTRPILHAGQNTRRCHKD